MPFVRSAKAASKGTEWHVRWTYNKGATEKEPFVATYTALKVLQANSPEEALDIAEGDLHCARILMGPDVEIPTGVSVYKMYPVKPKSTNGYQSQEKGLTFHREVRKP